MRHAQPLRMALPTPPQRYQQTTRLPRDAGAHKCLGACAVVSTRRSSLPEALCCPTTIHLHPPQPGQASGGCASRLASMPPPSLGHPSVPRHSRSPILRIPSCPTALPPRAQAGSPPPISTTVPSPLLKIMHQARGSQPLPTPTHLLLTPAGQTSQPQTLRAKP
jgi:hypothetical protein